jgi:hypothetical protein
MLMFAGVHFTRQLLETPADARVVESGSRPLLEWCATQTTYCHALYGRFNNLPWQAPDWTKCRAFALPPAISLRSGIALMRWDNAPIVRRVVRWVDAVRNGKPDRKAINFPAEFVPGASIGPVCWNP